MAQVRLNEIRTARLAKRQLMIAQGSQPYPSEAQRSHIIANVLKNFTQMVKDAHPLVLVGRLQAIRQHGGVVFLDISDSSGKIQLQISKDNVVAEFFSRLEQLDVGDFIQVAGQATTTKRNEPTILVAEWHMLAKSIRPLPSSWHGLKDHEARWRHRELDILLNEAVQKILLRRSEVTSWLRHYFVSQDYIEFDTPVLQSIAGGAAARPFTTRHAALDQTLYLRIAAELHLKRLLVAGFEKVFELGQRFRNEGIDRHHNPEFTMLESQWAYADYEDLMSFTEELFERLAREVMGTTDITWQDKTSSWTKPFKRVRYVDLVSAAAGVDILADQNPATYIKILTRAGLDLPDTKNYSHLVDELYKNLIRPKLQQPTLVYDYPAQMAPLAKRAGHDERIAEKFQLVIAGMELCNCYSELNDPVLQRAIFTQAQKEHSAGDPDAAQLDLAYLEAMEYGMPPNAGFGLGVDRLVMLLTNAPSIREVTTFPLMRSKST